MSPAFIKELSKTAPTTLPFKLSSGFPLVIVWGDASVNVHVTVSPDDTFTGFGIKQLFVVTQVAFFESLAPCAMVTVVSANTDGTNTKMPTTRVKTMKSEPISFDFMDLLFV